ncbi:MAG: glycosyltransferase family 2 protein [Elusimicrobia bacterium]|nr:glycosyltransferase family 2 protein [Elusimicrobiota bacterium]
MTQLSVIIPTLREAGRIEASVRAVAAYLGEKGIAHEFLVVDGASADGTAAVVEKLGRELPHVALINDPENLGKGYAVKLGMLRARGELRVFLDADLSTPIDELSKLLEAASRGHDVVIGSRGMAESNIIEHQPFFREISGKFYNNWVEFWTGLIFQDTQCGFKLFTSRAAEKIFTMQRCTGFAFDVELLFIARKLGYKIAEVPVRWKHAFPSKARVLQTGWETFWDTTRIPRWHRNLSPAD